MVSFASQHSCRSEIAVMASAFVLEVSEDSV